jgi:2-isopropylmalate synthase
MAANLVAECKKYTSEVEFSAEDAVRAEPEFLNDVIRAVVAAGATRINICDSEGTMMPAEMSSFVKNIYDAVPELSDVTLSVELSDQMNMAVANAFSAILAGAGEVKTVVEGFSFPSVESVMNVFKLRGDANDISSKIRTTELSRTIAQMKRMINTTKSETSPFENGVNESDESLTLDKNDTITTVIKAVKKIGYDLSEEDNANVYDAFKRVAAKKDFVGTKELEAIIASTALQVPATYTIESYVINSGNVITATANIKLVKDGAAVSGVSVGDGPIDAAFLAIEQIVGHHYELDDFQIKSVTEGREAMGSALVKLRSASGKLYSGTGISTDVIGASIRAYVSALNKIVYEEE